MHRNTKRPLYIQVSTTLEEKEKFREAAREDGHKWLDGWFRWLAIGRTKKILKEKGTFYERDKNILGNLPEMRETI